MPLEPLAQLELDEANSFLGKFREDSHISGLLYCWAALWLLGALILLPIDWPERERSTIATGCGIFVWIWGYALALRSRRNFKEMRSRFIKLQRAGYALYKDREFLFEKFIAVQGPCKFKYDPVDFEQITPRSRLWL